MKELLLRAPTCMGLALVASVALAATAIAVPPNDECENATAIGEVAALAFSTVEATPSGIGTCMTSPDVFYCYTPTCTGEAHISLCDSLYDTKLAVYDGCGCVDPVELGCNDDACYVDALQSELWIDVVAGNQYLIQVGGYSSSTGDGFLDVTCTEYPPGACCIDMICMYTNLEQECLDLGGYWYEGETCPEFECPDTSGDTCEDPLMVSLSLAGLPYVNHNYTCGRIDDYENTCLGSYDGGEDIIYELEVLETMTVDILLDPLGTTWTGIALDVVCPPGDPCMASSTSYSAVVHGIEQITLEPGYYYIMVDTWPSPDCIPEFDLYIQGLVTGACCVGEICEFTGTLEECDNAGGVWYEGETCPEFDCPVGCEHTVCLTDDYGDGWNGGMLDIFVNSVLVLDDLTIVTGSGPDCFTFLADTGDLIEAVYTGSGWPEENEYYILDGWGIEIFRDGAGGTVPTGGETTGNCVMPLGACCIEYICEFTSGEEECVVAGGDWYVGETCPEFECPVPPTGACCVDLVCVETTFEEDCDAIGGFWYEGETCPEFECPVEPGQCPPGTLYGQTANFATGVNSDADAGYIVWDNFSTAGVICDVHFWALRAFYSGGWTGCDEDPMTFEIKFYDDDLNMPGVELCSYTYTLFGVDTGVPFGSFGNIQRYDADLTAEGCCTSPGYGWISVQGMGGEDCWFLWITSDDGDGLSYQNETQRETDQAFCLTGEYVPTFGACCEELTGVCVDDVEWINCIGPNQRFQADTLCEFMEPPCILITGACCLYNEECLDDMTEADCVALGGIYMGDFTTCLEVECEGFFCEAGGGCDEFILQVQLGDINNISECDGYADFTDLMWTDLQIGNEYTITVTLGNPYASDKGGLWIDWNQDWDFDDEGEALIFGDPWPWSGVGPYTLTFSPPADAVFGFTTMRIRLQWGGGDPLPCGVTSYGEVEDYGIDVTAGCLADVNGDSYVDVLDLLAVIAAWGNLSGPEDINGDGLVDIYDLLLVIGAWGACAP